MSTTQTTARFIWVNDGAPRRNQFVRFEREVDLAEAPTTFSLRLFADTRYRLRVNDAFVATGPGRFVTQHPEYDTHELAPWLKPGRNRIAVEVNFFGASSYQSMPDGQPGFIAWGGHGGIDLSTPGDWRAFRLTAWRSEAPLFSFAQNPCEICDTRLLDSAAPVELRVFADNDTPWGELPPYSGRPIPFTEQRPKRIELAGALATIEQRYGFMSHDPDAETRIAIQGPKPWTAFATWIHSPRKQMVQISTFWGEFVFNGQPVHLDINTPRGNHGFLNLDMREGWNLLVGQVEILTEYWAFLLGIPAHSGLTLHGTRDAATAEPFAVAPNGIRDGFQLPTPDDAWGPAGWLLNPGDVDSLTPARVMGWDVPAAEAVRGLPMGRWAEVSTIHAAEATWCVSFAGEFLGHVELDVEAPAGTILDVACDDWQAGHGGVALYRSNPFTDAADRFILRGGRQRIQLFHPRGGKLLQVTARSPAGPAALYLHDIVVHSRQSLGRDETRFASDMPVLDWVWPVALRTLIVSTDEAYSDCPWRERGSYIGDGYVNLHLNQLLDSDPRTARRTLRIFAQAQLPDGQLACCAPAWLRRPHEDFTLIWILTLRDYWLHTGDLDLVADVWPALQRIWRSPTWVRHPSGLWNADKLRVFIDWGVLNSERSGSANAAINLFRLEAARATATLASALAREREVIEFQREAEQVDRAIRNVLWIPAEGRLAASEGATTPALHANVLALAFRLGDEALRSRILNYLEPRLRDNFTQGLRNGQGGGHLELYFLHYALPALAEHGRPDLAEALIEQHYGFLQRLGDDTLPECFARVERGVGSRCHSWAGAAAIYAARYVLGIRPAASDQPRRLRWAPVVHGITRASGRIAHPDGWIEVAWEKVGGEFRLSFTAPDGVEIELDERQPVLRSDS
jgi:hypothetical protein